MYIWDVKPTLVAAIISVALLTSCSANGDNANSDSRVEEESKGSAPILSSEDKQELLKMYQKLNSSFDSFTGEMILDSRPKLACSGHAIWFQMNFDSDGKLTKTALWLLSNDDIGSNIGNPYSVLVNTSGNISEYGNTTAYSDPIECEGTRYDYPSEHSLDFDLNAVEIFESSFEDPMAKYRLRDEFGGEEFRDVKMTSERREVNFAAIRILASLLREEITLQELMGKS